MLDVLFLLIFWTWVVTGALFLRNTFLPRMPIQMTPDAVGLSYEPVRFRSTDGLWLSGWKLTADLQAPWIIICHGLGTNRADLLDVAAALVQAGYNVLTFDFRAHAESQGKVTSFGWREQRDLEGALAFLGSLPDMPERPYGVYGVSMGGAVAIMVAARDERLAAVAVDSIYSDLEESIAHHLKLLYRLPRVPFSLFAGSAYRLRFGVWPRRMSPVSVIGQISPRAVLVVQGDGDPRVPLAQGQALFQAAGEPKDLWVIQGTEHLASLRTDPAAYMRRLVAFFDSFLKHA